MSVVIQEMVAAEAAGVLFTREPNTGNPSKILITANFGLGEVSQILISIQRMVVAGHVTEYWIRGQTMKCQYELSLLGSSASEHNIKITQSAFRP